MPRLIVQADDNGISTATASGVLAAVRRGIVRNTGLFTNMPAGQEAAAMLRDVTDVSVGVDLNFVTGRPLSDRADVPTLVGADGAFRPSGQVRRDYDIRCQDGFLTTFSEEPFPYEETLREGRAQVARFVELMGRPPAYVHHHALTTPTTDRVVTELAAELGVPVPLQVMSRPGTHMLPNPWYLSPFPLQAQADADPLTPTLHALHALGAEELGVLITHPGYLDADLLESSSFSVVRVRDLQMLLSDALTDAIAELDIELTTYSELAA